ncbi:MAG: hypothetical protein N2C14_28175, partial [Planctomycetales bacterium]
VSFVSFVGGVVGGAAIVIGLPTCAAWATLDEGRSLPRIIGLLVSVWGIPVVLVLVFRDVWLYPPWLSFSLVFTFIVVGSLLVVRSSGYRIPRRATVEEPTAGEDEPDQLASDSAPDATTSSD